MVNKCSAVYFITQKMIVFLSKPFMQSPVLIHINQYFFSETLNQKVATGNRLFTIPGKVNARLKSINLLYQLLVPVFLLLFLLVSCKGKNKASGPVYGITPVVSIPEYHFIVPPFNNPAHTVKVYQPLMDYLNSHVKNAYFTIETSADYESFENKYKHGSAEILLLNPLQTIQAIETGYEVILKLDYPEGLKAIFIVRKDAGINTPSDLKGKTISYPSPNALAASIMTQYFLHKSGINVNKDIKKIYVGSHESAIMNVYMKNSAAAGSTIIPWNDFQVSHPEIASELKVIWETEFFINGSIMFRKDIDTSVRNQVTACLLKINESDKGREILSAIQIKQFLPASNKDYERVKQYIQRFEKEVRKIEMK